MCPSLDVQLTPTALRRALDLLDAGPHQSLDDLIEALILAAEIAGSEHTESAKAHADVAGELPDRAPLQLADGPRPSGQLLFLTNRFGPLKLAARVLAEMSLNGEWPELRAFQKRAATFARTVGLRLRAEDADQNRRGAQRRWVAYPVGADEKAALERFVFSFTLFFGDGAVGGPLAQLGLASVDQGRALLTEDGWALGRAASPTLDGAGDGTLSADEIALLRNRLVALPDEAAAVREFLRAVRRAGGVQRRVDELLGTWHREWTADRAAAERSAMLGRLGELQVLEVAGRGPAARIDLIDSAGFEGADEP